MTINTTVRTCLRGRTSAAGVSILGDPMNLQKIIGTLTLTTLSGLSSAVTLTTNIESVGCHITSDMCFVYVEDVIQTACANNDGTFRWDGTNGSNREEVMSILLSAQARGSSVSFGGAGDSCYQNFPSFSWVRTSN